MVPNLARSTVGPPDHCFSKHALTKWARRRPASAAAPTTRARAAGTSSRPASASFVRRDLATGACSTVKRVPYDEPEDWEDWNARNLPYTSPASDPHGSPLPQFRALSSGFLNYKERELMSRARSPGDAPPRQPDCVRAWTRCAGRTSRSASGAACFQAAVAVAVRGGCTSRPWVGSAGPESTALRQERHASSSAHSRRGHDGVSHRLRSTRVSGSSTRRAVVGSRSCRSGGEGGRGHSPRGRSVRSLPSPKWPPRRA